MALSKEMDPTLIKALGVAMGYLSLRSRSIQEVRDYLFKRKVPPVIVEQAIRWLQQENYLDDKIFAKNYLDNRRRNKPKSIYAFRYELSHKGIADAIIDPLLDDYDDLELAFMAVLPKIKSWQHLEIELFKKKLFNFLRYRGFGFSTIQSTWQQILTTVFNTDPSE